MAVKIQCDVREGVICVDDGESVSVETYDGAVTPGVVGSGRFMVFLVVITLDFCIPLRLK
jgi:hypothetical protein